MPTFRVQFLLVALAPCTIAQAAELPIKFTATEVQKVDFIVPLIAPNARSVAVSNVHGLAAVGHEPGQPAQISLFKLDVQGKPTGNPAAVKTPRPDHLGPRGHRVLSLQFHPKLPLLYVWQDVVASKADPPPVEDPAWKDFDHLLIYSLDGPAPELLLAAARGKGFLNGVTAGSLAIDATARRLFVPNTHPDSKYPLSSGIGIFHLDGDGLPIIGEAPPDVKVAPPVLDPKKAAADRPARVAALRTTLAAGKPIGAFWTTPESYSFSHPPCGAGIFPISPTLFVAQGAFGICTWDQEDRVARESVFLIPCNFTSYYTSRLGAHPTLPVLFATAWGYTYLYRVEHCDGRPTLTPQVAQLEAAPLRTAPVVLSKRNLVAAGSAGCVYLVAIDADGKLKAEGAQQVNVPSIEVNALVYSEKYNLLYVAADKKSQ